MIFLQDFAKGAAAILNWQAPDQNSSSVKRAERPS
jgi:hypothetical protein